MKVVFDTNVLMAAFISNGLCKDLFEFSLKELEMITSEYILSEMKKNLSQKFKFPAERINDIDQFIRHYSQIITPKPIKSKVCRDLTDLPILATAVSAKASVIVSGDDDLSVLKVYKNIAIISPRDFWTLLSKNRIKKS